MKHELHLVDVFTEQAYSGNPLAVVLAETPLSEDRMLLIAAEMNFSETTFVNPVPEADGGYRVRIYTPSREIDFAGHPILGTAWVLRNRVQSDKYDQVVMNLSVGRVPVRFDSSSGGPEVAWFEAPEMTLGDSVDRESMAAALGITSADLEQDLPIRMVSAGISAMIVPIRSLAALKRARLNLDVYSPLADRGFPPITYLFTRETHDPGNSLCARFFFEAHGVREDPATGNGAAFLGAYLLEHPVFPESNLKLRIEQGHEVRRPSLILLDAWREDSNAVVEIGGSVVAVAKGELV